MRSFMQAMKADDDDVRSAKFMESTEKTSYNIKKIYKTAVGLLEGIQPGEIGVEFKNMLKNPIFDLNHMTDPEATSNEINLSDVEPQFLRMFDQEARKHLLFLSKRINNYEGEMIYLSQDWIKAPFELNEKSQANLDLINQVFQEASNRSNANQGQNNDSR